MYIYQIYNLVNKKSYIGSTNDPIRRRKEHFQSAHNPNSASYNYPLQKAIRKYGDENFTFNILEECALECTAEREQQNIMKYNSLTNNGHGYNQTLYTDCALRDEQLHYEQALKMGIKCALVDIDNNILQIFNSYHEAARFVGASDASPIRDVCNGKVYSIYGKIIRRVRKDGTIEIPINQTRPRKTAIKGINIQNPNDIVYYESISEAARVEHLSRASISKCVNGSTRYSKVGNRIWRKVGDAL